VKLTPQYVASQFASKQVTQDTKHSRNQS